jgi:hypothetical protein
MMKTNWNCTLRDLSIRQLATFHGYGMKVCSPSGEHGCLWATPVCFLIYQKMNKKLFSFCTQMEIAFKHLPMIENA